LIVIDGCLMDPSATLVYVPESKLPTTLRNEQKVRGW
jgi:hypothetical protein